MDIRNNQALDAAETFPVTSITLELTKRCPLACDYCFSHCFNKETNQTDLSPEMGKKAIDWLFDPKTNGNATSVDISFWGGEPLVKWDLLKELVLYAEGKSKDSGIGVTFGGTTNGVLLTPDKFDFLDQHSIFFLLSIDGTREHHDAFRRFPNGSGSWDIIMRNAEQVLARWPFYKVRLSFTVEHIEGLLEDIKCLYDNGFREIIYSPVSEGNWTHEKLDTLKSVFHNIAQWYMETKINGKPISIKYIDDGCNQLVRPMGEQAPCGAGRGYVGIAVDGSIAPCHRFHKVDDIRPWYEKETCLGHIEYGILNHSLRNQFTRWKPENVMCSRCGAFKVSCTGGCWASNYDINGDICKPTEPLCTVSQVNLEVAKAIRETEREYYKAISCNHNDITAYLSKQLDIIRQTLGD